MRFTRFWLGILLLVVAHAGRAQTPADTIAGELDTRLRRLQVSPLGRAVQVRGEIIQDLAQNRVARIPGLLDYLTQRIVPADTTGQLRLLPYEQWAVLAAAGEFYALLKQVETTAPRPGSRFHFYQNTLPDGLYDAARSYVKRHADDLSRTARAARFLPEDSAFLQLSIRLLAGEAPISDSLNRDLNRFLRRHPNSPYAYVVHRFVRYEVVLSPLTLAFDVFSGGATFRGELNRTFKPDAVFGIGAQASWKRSVLYLRLLTGFADARAPYRFGSAVWDPDLSLQYFLPEISVGYHLVDSRRLWVAPFVGVMHGYMRPNSAENAPTELDQQLKFARPFTAGLTVDVKLGLGPRTGKPAASSGGYLVRLRSGWRQVEVVNGPAASGTIYFFEVGVGVFNRVPQFRH